MQAAQKLKAVVRGTGIVEFNGDPLVQTNVFGTGRVVQMRLPENV